MGDDGAADEIRESFVRPEDRNRKVPQDVPVLGIKSGRYDLQRLIYYTMFKCYWNDRLSFDENVHINFDWYHPRYAWRHTEAEVRQWISDAGFRLVHENIEEAGITVRGKKDAE